MAVDFYCSEKFTWLSVDLEKRTMHSCCVVLPERIDMTWVSKNPGQLFNTPKLQQERQDMLNNIPVASCEDSCWSTERKGQISRRMIFNTHKQICTDIHATPKTVHLMLGSNCNLTCSYCSKQYSSSWRHDIIDNGSYIDGHNKFEISDIDRILIQVSQSENYNSTGFQTLLQELISFQNVNIYITGGEPFLYNGLPEFVNQLKSPCKIYTGLGVNHKRFQHQIDKLTNPMVEISISAENINMMYEFNRYGNSYDNFIKNLNLVLQKDVTVSFSAVMSNLTVSGLTDFIQKFGCYPVSYQLCTDPDFLNVNVLDDLTKQQIINSFDNIEFDAKNRLLQAIEQPYTQQQRDNFSLYIKEFARRRNLDLAIFPASMLEWIKG